MYVLIGYQIIDTPAGEVYTLQLIQPNAYIHFGNYYGDKVLTEQLEPNRFVFDNFQRLDQAIGRLIEVDYNVFRDSKRIHVKLVDDREYFVLRRNV